VSKICRLKFHFSKDWNLTFWDERGQIFSYKKSSQHYFQRSWIVFTASQTTFFGVKFYDVILGLTFNNFDWRPFTFIFRTISSTLVLKSRECKQHDRLSTDQKLSFERADVLFICKTKSRLRRRHCGLARHFKTDPTETVALCFGYAKTLFWRRRHCGLVRHFKTDPTKTVALCFGYAKTLFWRADGKADEQDISPTWLQKAAQKSFLPQKSFFWRVGDMA
jgi:hypothetical protein